MNLTLRPGTREDAKICGTICYEAFKTIAEQHGFPPDFPSPAVAIELLAGLLAHPSFYAVVAELDGRIVGSNFVDECSATEGDLDACNQVCLRVHGHDRGGELLDAIKQGTATVVEHGGRITVYATALGWFAHAVGETNEELKALIGAAQAFPAPGFLLPTCNGELFRWCLEHGLRVVQPLTLMSIGLYNEPRGAFLPSILY